MCARRTTFASTLAAAAYLPSLDGQFQFDDWSSLQTNWQLRDPAAYLDSVDERVLARDVDRYAAEVRRGDPQDQRTEISQKNLAIVVKRQERMHEIQNYMGVARGQLDLIENSFQLIADQIVTMQSPKELSGQLDELLEGVEAIKQSARDTEAMLEASGLTNP